MSNNFIATILMILIASFWGLIILEYIHFSLGNSLWFYPLGFLTLLFVVIFFFNKRHEFDKSTFFSKTIRFIGRRTLDIYFIHYFFLAKLVFLKPYFTTGNPVLIQLTVGGVISLLIVGISLLAGEVLRMSPTLSEWMLGTKKNNPSVTR